MPEFWGSDTIQCLFFSFTFPLLLKKINKNKIEYSGYPVRTGGPYWKKRLFLTMERWNKSISRCFLQTVERNAKSLYVSHDIRTHQFVSHTNRKENLEIRPRRVCRGGMRWSGGYGTGTARGTPVARAEGTRSARAQKTRLTRWRGSRARGSRAWRSRRSRPWWRSRKNTDVLSSDYIQVIHLHLLLFLNLY